jgi:hypothetical protein
VWTVEWFWRGILISSDSSHLFFIA